MSSSADLARSRRRDSADRVRHHREPPANSRYRSRSPRVRSRYSRSRSRSYSPVRRTRSRSRSRHRSYSRSSPTAAERRRSENPKKSRCLGVFGLNVFTTREQILEIFQRFGSIERVQVVIDAKTGRSRGYCFVYFVHTEDATVAKDNCTGMELNSRIIRVDYSFTQCAHKPTPGVYMGRPSRFEGNCGSGVAGGAGDSSSGVGGHYSASHRRRSASRDRASRHRHHSHRHHSPRRSRSRSHRYDADDNDDDYYHRSYRRTHSCRDRRSRSYDDRRGGSGRHRERSRSRSRSYTPAARADRHYR